MSPLYVPDENAMDGIAEVDLFDLRERIARRIFGRFGYLHDWDEDNGYGRNLAYGYAAAAITETVDGVPTPRSKGEPDGQ